MTETPAAPPQIFDRRRRRLHRDRMAIMASRQGERASDFLSPIMSERLEERLDDVQRPTKDVLLIGAQDGAFVRRLKARGFALTMVEYGAAFAGMADAILTDEDQLIASGLAPASFDLILWNGGLDSVNDVPGALIQCRTLLRPEAVLLGVCMGAGTLDTLRTSLRSMESEQGVARFHPQIDVRAMGDLLHRCGYQMPMADSEPLTVRYRSFDSLTADLRGSGLSNKLAGPVIPFSRASAALLRTAFDAQANAEGRIAEQFNLLYFIGWTPAVRAAL